MRGALPLLRSYTPCIGQGGAIPDLTPVDSISTVDSNRDQEWYWLQKIYGLLAQPSMFLDWIVPLSTVLLAGAAIYLAYRSYRTSRDANEQAARFRADDLAERDLRWRRTFALDLRDWYWYATHSAWLSDEDRDQERELYRELIRACDLAGQETAKQLTRWLASEAMMKRETLGDLTPKKRAQAMHPSQMGIPEDHRRSIEDWVTDPSLIEPALAAFAANQADARNRRLHTPPGGGGAG